MDAHALEIKKLGKNFKKGSKTKVAYAYQGQGNYSTVCCVIKNLSRLTSLIFIDSSGGELIANSRFSARVLLCCTALCADAKKKKKVLYFISDDFSTRTILIGMHICARAETLWDCVHLITYPRSLKALT